MRLPRYFKRACPGGWVLCDFEQTEPLPKRRGNLHETSRPGKPLHIEPISKEDATMLAEGLNSEKLSLDEVMQTFA
jgi:hypothetical protein